MTAYHLEGNGLVEKQNPNYTQALKACISEEATWYDCLDSIAFSFWDAQHHSTDKTPYKWCSAEGNLHNPAEDQTILR